MFARFWCFKYMINAMRKRKHGVIRSSSQPHRNIISARNQEDFLGCILYKIVDKRALFAFNTCMNYVAVGRQMMKNFGKLHLFFDLRQLFNLKFNRETIKANSQIMLHFAPILKNKLIKAGLNFIL